MRNGARIPSKMPNLSLTPDASAAARDFKQHVLQEGKVILQL